MTNPLFPPWDQKLPWNKSQADFVTHVLFYTKLGILGNDEGNLGADDMGELFLKVYDVDLTPYPDFQTVRIVLGPAKDPDLVYLKCVHWAQGVEAVHEALDGTGAEPSDELKMEVMAGLVIMLDLRARLSRHVGPWPGMKDFPWFFK